MDNLFYDFLKSSISLENAYEKMDPASDPHEYCTGGLLPDDIVISGVSGRFPECLNVGELEKALFSKKNLLIFSPERFEKGMANLPYDSSGLIKDLDKFDSGFFQTTTFYTNSIDPASRKLLEVTYEAIADAAIDPSDLAGEHIGVFNGTVVEDSVSVSLHSDGIADINMGRSFNASRTSHTLNFTGPSISLDTACSSSAVALWLAVNNIKSGIVKAAVVTGSQINLHPGTTAGYIRYGICSTTGNSRPFDGNSDGMMRSEAITALFLQKAQSARRVYATIPAIRFYSGGHNPEGITVPSVATEERIMSDVLKDARITLDEIEYVETHGTGTSVGDPVEIKALSEVFTGNRGKPLLIGTIKSNIGHTEASAGLCGVIKAILTFENEKIPPNIKYEIPNPNCPALLDGRIVVVTEPTAFKGSYIPITSIGMGGAIVETLLKKNPITYHEKEKDGKLCRLVLFPATTDKAISFLFDYIQNTPKLSDGFFTLLSKLSFTDPSLKPFRGYALYSDGDQPIKNIKQVFSNKRQIWFVMTGMGCQWPGMGLQLMQISEFSRSIKRSAETLRPYGIDLLKILKEGKTHPQRERNITASFVGICAIQVALIDVLKQLDIKPDGIVGHSTGELLCAYADSCFSAEQTVLAAYHRGNSVENANLPQGQLAAVGLPWNEVEKMCPKDVYAVCDNADDSVTISGLKEPLENFVQTLKQRNIFVRMVNAHGYSFHCEHVLPVVPSLRKAMNELITDPKPRSERWISSSYPKSEWEKPECKIASGEYFVHNLTSRVLFKDAVKMIPSDAMIIEIGPHFLLQPLMKRNVGSKAVYLGLMKRNDESSIKFFLDSLGQMYNEGVNPKIERLYPPVKFPVARGTPMISNLIHWNHSETFNVPKYIPKSSVFSREFNFMRTDDYILDHKIDGKVLFPATGYIYLVWETLALNKHKNFEEVPIVVERFKIHKPTVITQNLRMKFSVNILDTSGRFEIHEKNSVVASGRIYECKNVPFKEGPPKYTINKQSISGREIYDQFRRIGYEYGPSFQSLLEVSIEGTSGLVQWKNKWIPFLDALMLFFAFEKNEDKLFLPTGALYFKIDPNVLRNTVQANNSSGETEQNAALSVPVIYNKKTRTCRSVGVEITDLTVVQAARRQRNEIRIMEEYKFVPYENMYEISEESFRQVHNYCNTCNELIVEIGKHLRKSIKQYTFSVESKEHFKINTTNDIAESRLLENMLKSILDGLNVLKTCKDEIFASYSQSMGKDMLNNALVNEDTVRILLDIIYENTFTKLSVIEINMEFPIILKLALEIVGKYNYMQFKTSILITPKIDEVDQLLDKEEIQVFSEDRLDSIIKSPEESKLDIAMGSFMCGPLSNLKTLLQTLTSVIKKNGFILLFYKSKVNSGELFLSSLCGEEFQVHSESTIEKILQEENLVILSKVADPLGSCVYLLRFPCLIEPQKILLIKDSDYKWVESVKKEIFEKKSGAVWLVAEHSRINGIVGMVKCLIREPSGQRIRCIFISPTEAEKDPPHFSMENPFYARLFTNDLVMNVWKNGSWGSFRHTEIRKAKLPRLVDHSYMKCQSYGDLSSFQWMESSIKYMEWKKENLVHVYYSALNFRDVMLASGKLPTEFLEKTPGDARDNQIGFEYSGRQDGTGRRVCGISTAAFATSVLADPTSCIEVPDNWTLEEAATIPIAYSTCYYALIVKAKLQKGDSILIHSGTGGVGQAAINIALSLDCEIFTTVGTKDKKEYLKHTFPQIKEENIGCSRNTSFEEMILERTNGRGVDVVLNSLADDKFHASLRCVARNGSFAEIGKFDIVLDHEIGLNIFDKNIAFFGLDLKKLFAPYMKGKQLANKIMDLLREGVKNGVVKPLDRTVFDKSFAEDAFRYMTKGTHVGKVLLKLRDEEMNLVTMPEYLKLPAIPETFFYYYKVYIIIGGLGGFGMEVAKWIAERGGRNIILTSRYGARTPYHYFCLKRWQEQGLNVQVSTLNVVNRDEAEKLLKEASCIGPVGGIFNSALVLKDSFMNNQSEEKFQEVCDPKAVATKNLDELSRKLCPSLDHFICFSSVSSGRGNAGQTNYGFANFLMERICEMRKREGLPGLAIQWGVIGEVGLVHRQMGEDALIAGFAAQSLHSCLETLDAFCQQEFPVVTSYVSSQQVNAPEGEFTSQIAKSLGIDTLLLEGPSKTLENVGLDSFAKAEVKHIIDVYTDMNISYEQMQDITLEDVRKLLRSLRDKNCETSFLFASENVKLPPVLRYKEPLIVIENDLPGDPIFLVNIGNADVNNFHSLAVELQRPAFALVSTDDEPCTSVKSLASWYLKIIHEKRNGPFHLVGYSLGGSVAFEMALQSVKSDTNMKTVTFLSGSDDLIKTLSKDDAERIDPEIMALCRFVEQFISSDTPKLKNELSKEGSQEKRIQIVISYLTNSSSHVVDKNELSEAIVCYLQKHKLVSTFIPSGKLSMDINIVESSAKMLANDVVTVQELFSQICCGKISIYREFFSKQLATKEDVGKVAEILRKYLME
ncbi:unnamed protein product [Larinioides sclopetarius]|uniref:Fatty acid synthase n=1 Tax=Larinioides sclopetarius TaxID=280406 RepID=A0AAV2B2I0_9ARAC